MKIKDITDYLASIAPPPYQESYDNSGLLVGDPNWEAKKALICLDCTEAVVEEAIKHDCNLIISHHPVIFKGLDRLTGADHVQRTVMQAIRHDIAIYAIHTNLDNVQRGVNAKISEKLKLTNLEILAPKRDLLKKLVAFCSSDQSKALREVLQRAGIGGRKEEQNKGKPPVTSPMSRGRGKHLMSTPSTPAGFGQQGARVSRVETVFPAYLEGEVTHALFSQEVPEDFRYEIISIDNEVGGVGSGMVGELQQPVAEKTFLKRVKKVMETSCIRYTDLRGKKVKKVAVCGGAGRFLLKDAIRADADVFVTADFKYHDFFNTEGRIVVADIGHYESEQFTKELLYTYLQEKFPKFALRLTNVNTNPVNYL